jgi:hypothetical protein
VCSCFVLRYLLVAFITSGVRFDDFFGCYMRCCNLICVHLFCCVIWAKCYNNLYAYAIGRLLKCYIHQAMLNELDKNVGYSCIVILQNIVIF